MPVSVKRQYNHSGGVHYTDDLDNYDSNELSNAQNIRIDRKSITQRGGQTKLNSSAVQSGADVHSLFRFYKDDGSTRYLIGFAGTRMLEMKASPGNWESSPTSFSSGTKMDAAVMDDTFFFGNGVDSMQSTTAPGGSLTAVVGAPNANLITAVPSMNRIFASAPNSKRISYNALLDPTGWTTPNDAGFFDVPFTEGENITAHAAIPNGSLAIFSNSSFHTLTGTDPGNFTRQEIDPAIGCKAPRSIAAGRGGIYFLANNNRVYWTNGGDPLPVSEKIDTYLAEGSVGDYANAVGWAEGTRYHLAISFDGGDNDTVLVKDWTLSSDPNGGWMIDKQIEAASVAVDDGVEGQVYTGDYSGYVQQQDFGTTDNGTAISSFWDTADESFGEPARRKKVRRIRPKFEPTGNYPVTVSIATDGGAFTVVDTVSLYAPSALWGAVTWGAFTWGSGSDDWIDDRVSAIRNCKSFKVRYAISNPFRYFGHTILFRLKFMK